MYAPAESKAGPFLPRQRPLGGGLHGVLIMHVTSLLSPKRATSFPDGGSYEYDHIRVCLFSIVFSCLGLLSCIELCIFLCRLVLFVSTLTK